MVDGFFLGAYATAPSLNGWDEAAESAYYNALRELPNIRGLEIPFSDALHSHDEAWLLDNLAPSWDVVLTLIPGTMARIGKNPKHGLASRKASGRSEALVFCQSAREAVRRLNDRVGRSRVVAVELHSAPRRVCATDENSSADALTQSLAEIASWDWEGARLCVEHCDAWRADHAPFKGFLDIGDEIEAIKRANAASGADIGIAINWGRSVLEDRDPATAVKHIERAADAGLLAGLIFSGCSSEDTPWGAWDDTHMPHAPAEDTAYAAVGSLMSDDRMSEAISAMQGVRITFLGAKITAFPASADIQTRIGLNRSILGLMSRL